MAVGGLRGAIAFALVYMIEKGISNKKMFVTTTLFIILFTVIVLGTVTKPLVAVLRVRRQERRDPRSVAFINRKVIETFLPIIEEFAGHHKTGEWMAFLERLNNNCLRRWLVRGGPKTVHDKDDLLDVQKHPHHDTPAPSTGPFKDVTQDFKRDDYDDNRVDPALEQLRKPPRPPIEAEKVNRERVQYSKNIGKAFAESKVENKPRNSSLFLGRQSKAPVYQQPMKSSSNSNNKETFRKAGKTSNVENDLKDAVNRSEYYRKQP